MTITPNQLKKAQIHYDNLLPEPEEQCSPEEDRHIGPWSQPKCSPNQEVCFKQCLNCKTWIEF